MQKIVPGIIILFAASKIDFHIWQKVSRFAFIISIILVVALMFSGSGTINGAKRWLSIGGFQFQPSELLKLSLIFLLSSKIATLKEEITNFKDGLLKLLVPVAIAFTLVLMQPNFSMGLIIVFISIFLVFIAGCKLKHLVYLMSPLLPGLVLIALTQPYRLKRILAFFSPEENVASSYQQVQSMISLGNGGFFGTGLGYSTQKLGYLPMPFTDTIYAILGEETGFVGAFVVLSLFGILIWRGFVIGKNAQSDFGKYLAIGITLSVFINLFIHIGVCTGLIPATGQPLPLISFGGSNLLMNLFALGILLNISIAEKKTHQEKKVIYD